MITIKTNFVEVTGSVQDILALFKHINGNDNETIEEPPIEQPIERDQRQTTLDRYEAFKQRISSQKGLSKANYERGRKIHSCSNCGALHRRIDVSTGRCKVCPGGDQ